MELSQVEEASGCGDGRSYISFLKKKNSDTDFDFG